MAKPRQKKAVFLWLVSVVMGVDIVSTFGTQTAFYLHLKQFFQRQQPWIGSLLLGKIIVTRASDERLHSLKVMWEEKG